MRFVHIAESIFILALITREDYQILSSKDFWDYLEMNNISYDTNMQRKSSKAYQCCDIYRVVLTFRNDSDAMKFKLIWVNA
jgi:hypothetical protein